LALNIHIGFRVFLSKDINTAKRNNTRAVRLQTDVGLEVNAEEITYSVCACLVTEQQDEITI
jgi:hypothetical protein